MKRKLSALLLALTLFVSLAAVPARAADSPAVLSPQSFAVDGKPVQAEVYNIGGSNYFKLRDIAMLLKDTDARFSVDYNEAARTIELTTGKAYVPNGSELKTGVDNSATCVESNQRLLVDGINADLKAYNIGGSNFFRLRDLGEVLRFFVGYDAETNTALLNSAYYIERIDYSEGLPISLYYEIPIFRGSSDALRMIEEEAEARRAEFAEGQALNALEYTLEGLEGSYPPSPTDPYLAEWDAMVFTCNDDIVSYGVSYSWYVGGVYDYGINCYNYDAKTGAHVYLTDVCSGTEDEIKESIIAALLDQYPGVEEAGVMGTPMDVIRDMDVHLIGFYVEDGIVHVTFSKYEIAFGAAGAFDVELGAAEPVTKG
ncbi:MAG: hypothetical protein E7425_10140 [Ruminococcaceae bacterium]|jgi:hypothetical protein|nr:hypothetical protein [Oscillospiraceae bacterium]